MSGFKVLESDTKRTLYEKNRSYNMRKSWGQEFLQSNVAAHRGVSSLTSDYSESINKAYAASASGMQDIASSTLGTGYKSELYNASRAALQQHYANASATFSEETSKISNLFQKSLTAIDEAATIQASNLNKFHNTVFDYYESLYDNDRELFDSPLWAKFTTYDEDLEADRLLTRDELMTPTRDKETNEYISLYDEEGNLTTRGVDFFDQMLNQQDSSYDIDAYLQEYDPELREWISSTNPYDFTRQAMDNLGSFKNMVGLRSTDMTYSFAERFGGLSKAELTTMFNKFESGYNDLSKAYKKNKGKVAIRDIKKLTSELESLTKTLGIAEDFDFAEINAFIHDSLNNTRTSGEMTGDWFGNTGRNVIKLMGMGSLMYPTASMATGLITGAGMAISKGVISTLALKGALIAGAVALAYSVVESSVKTEKQRKENMQISSEVNDMYENMLTGMIAYSHQKQNEVKKESKLF